MNHAEYLIEIAQWKETMPGQRPGAGEGLLAAAAHIRELESRVRELEGALRTVTDYAARNTCLHEETYRGGTIWEICSSCGAKWADDRGGKPANAHNLPPEIEAGYAALKGATDDPA